MQVAPVAPLTNAGAAGNVVIAHDFAEAFGGAERILGAVAATYPEAAVWAFAGRRDVLERVGAADRFHSVFRENDRLLRHYRLLAPLYPAIARVRRLPAADVLLTLSYAFAHGFRTCNEAPQVCYCLSPLRFAWSMTDAYAEWLGFGRAGRGAFRVFAAVMRRADRRAAADVTQYVAESRHVADQIRRAYGRDAIVIHPPVDCDLFRPSLDGTHDGYYLFCGRLIEPYKRPGLVIDAFRAFRHKLVIAGDGPAYRELKGRAGPNVEFVGNVSDAELVPLMQRCAATIFPSADDFGLVPLESMACGRPVVAFAGGGALETVVAGETGVFFDHPTTRSLTSALAQFDPDAFVTATIRAHAEAWDVARFQQRLSSVVAATSAPGREASSVGSCTDLEPKRYSVGLGGTQVGAAPETAQFAAGGPAFADVVRGEDGAHPGWGGA